MKSSPKKLKGERKSPKFKKGDRVFAETLGKGVIQDAYFPHNSKKEYLYHIKQGTNILGNVPESWITYKI